MKFLSELRSSCYGGATAKTTTITTTTTSNESSTLTLRQKDDVGRLNNAGNSPTVLPSESLRNKVKPTNSSSKQWKPTLSKISENSMMAYDNNKFSAEVVKAAKPKANKLKSPYHGEDHWKSSSYSFWAFPAFSPSPVFI